MTHPPDQTVFGADGGGTKTTGLLLGGRDTILAVREGGASNPIVVGIESSARTLVDLLLAACSDAGRSPEGVGAAVFGLAGAGTPAIRDRLLEHVLMEFRRREIPVPRMALETDARIALEGAFDGGPGIIVIAGTGSIVLGKKEDGSLDRVGGWGRVLGDEGSGYRIGLEALRAVAHDLDGGAEATVLRTLIGEKTGWTRREQIVAAVYQGEFAIPSLAPLVLEAAVRSDAVACGILEAQASELASQVRALARRLGGRLPHGLVFVGGLIEHPTSYAKILRRIIERDVPDVSVCGAAHPPEFGAALMARSLRETEAG
jgi:N-acetylglucosamine kinase-like BadF-type ATPase